MDLTNALAASTAAGASMVKPASRSRARDLTQQPQMPPQMSPQPQPRLPKPGLLGAPIMLEFIPGRRSVRTSLPAQSLVPALPAPPAPPAQPAPVQATSVRLPLFSIRVGTLPSIILVSNRSTDAESHLRNSADIPSLVESANATAGATAGVTAGATAGATAGSKRRRDQDATDANVSWELSKDDVSKDRSKDRSKAQILQAIKADASASFRNGVVHDRAEYFFLSRVVGTRVFECLNACDTGRGASSMAVFYGPVVSAMTASAASAAATAMTAMHASPNPGKSSSNSSNMSARESLQSASPPASSPRPTLSRCSSIVDMHARVYDNLVRAADVTPTTFADLVAYLVTLKLNEAVCENGPIFEVVHTLSRAWVLIHIPSPSSGQWMRPVRIPLRTLFPPPDAAYGGTPRGTARGTTCGTTCGTACDAASKPHWAWPLVAAAFLFTDRFAYGLHAQTASPVHFAYQFLRQAAIGAMPVDVQRCSSIEDLASDLGARAVVKHASALHAEIYCLVPNTSTTSTSITHASAESARAISALDEDENENENEENEPADVADVADEADVADVAKTTSNDDAAQGQSKAATTESERAAAETAAETAAASSTSASASYSFVVSSISNVADGAAVAAVHVQSPSPPGVYEKSSEQAVSISSAADATTNEQAQQTEQAQQAQQTEQAQQAQQAQQTEQTEQAQQTEHPAEELEDFSMYDPALDEIDIVACIAKDTKSAELQT